MCGFSRGGQENWLITQHIRRELAGGLRLRKVTVQIDLTLNGCDISNRCRQTFDVYKWQTSTINSTEARNTGNYENVGRVTPPITTGDTLNTEFQDIILDSENGFYLAIVDFSTCIGIQRILVLYYVCPEETSQLISRPETIESISLSEIDTFVDGECVVNSSTERGGNPLLICGRMGQWQVVIPCLCDSGYELVLDQCSGTCTYIYMYTCTRTCTCVHICFGGLTWPKWLSVDSAVVRPSALKVKLLLD